MGSYHNKQYAIKTFSLCSLIIILIIDWIAADDGGVVLPSYDTDLHQATEQTAPSSQLYAAAPFSGRALLAVNSLTASVTQRPQAPVLTKNSPGKKPVLFPAPKTSGSLSQQPQSPVLIQKSPGEKPVKAPVPTTSGSLTQRPQAPVLTQNSPGKKPAPKTSGSHPLSSSSLEAGLMSIFTPLVQTMTRSSKGVLFCWLCKPLARRDCIGLSDKTAYCICTDFSYKNIDAPAVCYFLQAQDDRQTSCKQGKHNCPPKKNCVDYAMTEKEMQITCVCPEGRFRGENCEDEYKLIDQRDNSSCVKTVNNGEICMCSVDDKNDKNGFCKLRSERVEPKAPVLTQQIPDIKSRRLPVPVGSSPQKETTDEVLPQIEAPVLNQQTPDMKPEIPSVPAESNSRSLLTTEPISNEKSLIKSSSGSSIEITSNASTETGRIQMWQNDLERAKQGTVLQSMDNRTLIGIVVAVPVGVLVCVLCFCRRGSSKQVKDKKVTSKGKSKKRERTDGTKDSKHKKKRKKLDADEETNAEKVDVNENSPLQVARGRRSSREYGRLWRYPASRTSSMTKLNLASHNNRILPGSKQDYVRQYIKRQRFVPGGFIREKCMSRNGFGTLNDADERIPLTRVNFEENGQIYPVRYSKSTFR